jgi:hypothetical protein
MELSRNADADTSAGSRHPAQVIKAPTQFRNKVCGLSERVSVDQLIEGVLLRTCKGSSEVTRRSVLVVGEMDDMAEQRI